MTDNNVAEAMRILYQSVAPWINTGYGRCTREITTHAHNNGHEVAIQPLTALKKGDIAWHGDGTDKEPNTPIKVYGSESKFGLQDLRSSFDKFDADLLFTHFDSWMEPARKTIPSLGVPYSSYVIVDHNPVPEAVVEQVLNAHETVSMSKFAKQKLSEKGVRSTQIPHGVNTDLYKPLEDVELEIKVQDEHGNERLVSLNDTFVFGMVAANHGSRKNIPGQMEAFKTFLEEEDEEAILYIHTDQNTDKGYNLEHVRKEIGIPKQNILWPAPENYQGLPDERLNKWYNTFDVMLNCSMGESWGLTITEAQSAGVPCIVTDFSSMPEQLGADPEDMSYDNTRYPDIKIYDHGLAVEPSGSMFMQKVSARQYTTHPSHIYEAMRYYYRNDDTREKHGKKAREYIIENYDWKEQVLPQFKDLFDRLEEKVT